MKLSGNVCGEGVDEELEGVGIQRGQFKKEALPCGRGHGPIDLEPFEDVLDRPLRVGPRGAVRRRRCTVRRPTTTVVLAEHAHRAGILRRDDRRAPLPTARLKVSNRRQGFFV